MDSSSLQEWKSPLDMNEHKNRYKMNQTPLKWQMDSSSLQEWKSPQGIFSCTPAHYLYGIIAFQICGKNSDSSVTACCC